MKLCDNPQCKWHWVSIPNRRGGVVYLPTEVGGGSVRRTRVGDAWLCEYCAAAVKVAMKTPVAWRYRRVGGEAWTLSHQQPPQNPSFSDVPLFQMVGCGNCKHQMKDGGCSEGGGRDCGVEYSDWEPSDEIPVP